MKLIVVAEWDGTSEGGTSLARLTIRCHPLLPHLHFIYQLPDTLDTALCLKRNSLRLHHPPEF